MKAFRLVVVLVLAVAAAMTVVQAGSGAGAIAVRGDQWTLRAELPPCDNENPDTYRMTGDLVGCWYTESFDVTQSKDNAGGSFKASGSEHFVGCLNTNGNASCDPGEPSGEFWTTFTFTAKLDPSGSEIHGRCHHPVVRGTGAFQAIRGVLSFKDIPSKGQFPYHGNLQF